MRLLQRARHARTAAGLGAMSMASAPPVIFLDVDGVLNRVDDPGEERVDATMLLRVRQLADSAGAVVVMARIGGRGRSEAPVTPRCLDGRLWVRHHWHERNPARPAEIFRHRRIPTSTTGARRRSPPRRDARRAREARSCAALVRRIRTGVHRRDLVGSGCERWTKFDAIRERTSR